MGRDKGFALEVSSRFDGWWRYNLTAICGCFDAEGKRTAFVSADDHVADAGSELSAPPAGTAAERTLRLVTPPCERIVAYVYLVPHTLPHTNEIGAVSLFDVTVAVRYGETAFEPRTYRVNQWSGASIELKLARGEFVR